MNRDAAVLFAGRMIRVFGYGMLAVVLVLYLSRLGFSDARIGWLLSLTLLGDTAVSLWLTTRSDRHGRGRTLRLGALLLVGAGIVSSPFPGIRPCLPGTTWPSLAGAAGALFLRYSISQMDVPTRQAYLASAVQPHERSAAAEVTGVARNLGASISPGLTGLMMSSAATFNLPFYLAGGLKILYDLALYERLSDPETRRTA